MTSQRYRCRASLWVITVSATVVVHAQEPGNLFDPEADVPATVYESALPQPMGEQFLDLPLYPWGSLYQADGSFVPESSLAGASLRMTMDSGMSQEMSHEDMNHGDSSGVSTSSGATDSRGVVKKIYRKDSKVKLKHGPIDKLEMPGMTMIFYVKDEALLDDINEGDEVGFDVQMDGSSFYITRFKR